METSEEPTPGPSGDQLEEGQADGKTEKKRKFKPFEAMRKFFRSSRKRLKGKEEENIVGLKAKSTSELVAERSEEDSDDGGFKTMSQTRSISEDSIFNPEQKEQQRVSQFTKGAKSAENVNQVSATKSASRESDKSLLSVGSLEHEEDLFETNWKASVASVVTRRSKAASSSETTMDFDLSAVQPTTALRSEAAKHRISVAPKARRGLKQGKRSTASVLPKVKEESPTKLAPASKPVVSKQDVKAADVVVKTPAVKPEGKGQVGEEKAVTQKVVDSKAVPQKVVDSKLEVDKTGESNGSMLPPAGKVKLPSAKDEKELKRPDAKIEVQKVEASQDSDKENSIEVGAKTITVERERAASVKKHLGLKENTSQESDVEKHTVTVSSQDVGKLPLRPTLSDPLDKGPKGSNQTVLAKASSLSREQANKPPNLSSTADKPFPKPDKPVTAGPVVKDGEGTSAEKKDSTLATVAKSGSETGAGPLSVAESNESDKVLSSPTKATADKGKPPETSKDSQSDNSSIAKIDSEKEPPPRKVSSLAAGFGKVSALSHSGAINGSSVSSKSAVVNSAKTKPLEKKSVSLDEKTEVDIVKDQSENSGIALSQESSKTEPLKTEVTVPRATVKLPTSVNSSETKSSTTTTSVSDSKPTEVASVGLVPSDKSVDSAQIHRLASPKEEYKMKRQGRSKTLPDQLVSKERVSESAQPTRNDYDNVIFSRKKPQIAESSASVVTNSSSEEVEYEKKAVKSSSVTSPVRQTNTVITQAAKRPEPKRLSLVSGLVSDSSEPVWVAMARKKSSEENMKDEPQGSSAPQTAAKPSRTPSDKSITKSSSINAGSSSPVKEVKVSAPVETETSQKPQDQKIAAVSAADDKLSVSEKDASTVPTSKPIRFVRTMASKPTPSAEKPPPSKSFIIEKPALTSANLPEKPKPESVSGTGKTSQQKSFIIEKSPMMTPGMTSKTETSSDSKTTSVPAWRSNLQKKKDPVDLKMPEMKKIEIIDKTVPISPQKPDSVKPASQLKSEPTPVVLREKTQTEKCVDVSARSSKVLDMVKNFQKLQVS